MPPAGPPSPPAPTAPPDPNASTKAETERLKASTELEKARAEAIRAIGLPSFDGKTSLNQGAGAIEALILATDALAEAATEIANAALSLRHQNGGGYLGKFLVIAGDETLDFGLAAAVGAEIEAFRAIFDAALVAVEGGPRTLAEGLAGPVAAISAIAGLLRTETEVTAVDHSVLSHRVLATAVAGRLERRAIFPGAATGGLPWAGSLLEDLMDLAGDRDKVAAIAKARASEEGEWLKAALVRFDAFFARVTAPEATGRVPVVQAARLKQLLTQDPRPLVLRVYVEKAGGSLVNRKNILTFFWGDPVRVSGGLVASYAITDPADGAVLAAAVLNGRTSIGKLRDIQAGGGASPRISSGPRDGGHGTRSAATANFAARTGSRTMEYKVTVKPDDGQRADWEIEYFKVHEASGDHGPSQLIEFDDNDDGTFSGTISLELGLWGLGCSVVGSGKKIEIDLEPAAPIRQGPDPLDPDPQWPLSAEVPDHQQQDLITIYFRAEGGQ